MTRAIAGFLLTGMLASRLAAQGADAVALAAQQHAEENYRRLSATVEEIQTAQITQRQNIVDLAAEVNKLRDEVAKAKNNAATQEALKRLSDQILKVDESRIADNKRIQDALEKLAKLISERPVLPPPVPPTDSGIRSGSGNGSHRGGNNDDVTPPKPPSTGAVTEEGFEYVIQPGDRLDLISSAYRAQGIMVTRKMIQDANPNVKWDRLKVGQKIFIPKPK